MANPLTPNMETGTIGELLVQLRLLEYGVQASPPLKDTGNDLIAIKGNSIKLIQVKTNGGRVKKKRIYDILARVILKYDESGNLNFDTTTVQLTYKPYTTKQILTRELVDQIWTQDN